MNISNYLWVFPCVILFSSFLITTLHFAFITTFNKNYKFYLNLHLCGSITSAILAIICAWLFLKNPHSVSINMGPWFSIDYLQINYSFLFDSLTVVMFVVVSFISACVQLYSKIYMWEDPNAIRFFAYLTLFAFFMYVLIFSGNLMLLFLGWEGVGIVSYLLINFWYTRQNANKAAIKAVLVNKFGDISLMLSMAAFFYLFGSLDMPVIFTVAPLIKDQFLLDFACLTLLGGAVAKSAQLGLHTWLPDAMEGPSPVSALIHAATMVTAGIFLIIRFSHVIEFSEITRTMCVLCGSLTAFFAATSALFQNDIKRVIAYSTCSQLGFMMFSCGLSGYDVGMYHLFNHAFFKALLFLSAGAIIHGLSDEQDMRRMGGLSNILRLSYITTLFGSMSLIGFPFFSGFYSKDGILERAFASYTVVGMFAYLLGSLAAFFTAFYSTRLIMLVFINRPNGFRQQIIHAHDASKEMAIVLIILTIPSLFIGYFTYDIFVGPGTDFWTNSILIRKASDFEFIPTTAKLFPVFLSFIGVMCGVFFNSAYKITNKFYNIYLFFNYKWFFDPLYNFFIAKPVLFLGEKITYRTLDRGFLEWVGPYGLAKIVNKLVSFANIIQNGGLFIYHGILLMVVGLIIILIVGVFGISGNFLLSLAIILVLFGLTIK